MTDAQPGDRPQRYEKMFPKDAARLASVFHLMRLLAWGLGLLGFFNLTRSWGPEWWHIPLGVFALMSFATLFPQKKWGLLNDDERD